MLRQTCLGLLREEIVIGQDQSSWFYLYLFYCMYLQIYASETLVINLKKLITLASHLVISVMNLEFRLDLILKAG